MAQMDLVIRGGMLANSDSTFTADIGIVGESIVQIGGDMEGASEIDASGKLVIPGGVDAHVHLTLPPGMDGAPNWVDDFHSGSAAAAAGGITTIGNMSFLMPGEGPLAALQREAEIAAGLSVADFFLHPVLTHGSTEVLDEIPQLLATGCNSIKFFMSLGNFDDNVEFYLRATELAGENNLVTLIHCEDYPLVELATRKLIAQGRTSIQNYPDSRPILSELVATQRAIAFAEATGAPVYIVHLSSERAMAACAEAQSRGVPILVETRPLYLHLTAERFEGGDAGKYVGQPPLRHPSDVDALWAAIQQGTLHTVCTDHAPWSLADKLDPSHTIEDVRPGTENLQVMLPMLYSEGVRTGRISLSRFVEVTSTNVAKIFGLYPRKGAILPGSDADMVIFDTELTKTISGEMLKSNADYSVFDGWEVTGWPVTTMRRGEVIFDHDEVIASPGSGQLLPRQRAEMI